MFLLYLILIIPMQVYTALLPSLPLHRDTRIDIGLMYYFRYQLRPVIDKIRAWG